MKLPNGNPPTAPAADRPLQPARPSGSSQPQDPGPTPSARAQLAQINLANRETALARVAEIINQTDGSSRLLLDIRGQSLAVNAAIGDTPLAAGDLIKIMRAGNELQLLGKLAPTAESTLARALAQRLPWQQTLEAGLGKALQSLANGLKTEPGNPSQPQGPVFSKSYPAPIGIRQALEQLATLLPVRDTLAGLSLAESRGPLQAPLASTTHTTGKAPDLPAASQIRQWIEQSGLFTESRLARTPDAPPADLKLALGRIVHRLLEQLGQTSSDFNRLIPISSPALTQTPLQFPGMTNIQAPQSSSEPVTVGQMLRLLAGVLNRITVNQLHSQALSARASADAPAANNTLLVDLPWLDQNNQPRTMQLRLEEQTREKDETRPNRTTKTEWKLALAMNLDQAGPMHFDVALGHDRISAKVWAERQSTLNTAREQLPALRQTLTDMGLEVTDLECRRGIPRGAVTHLEHRLVDTRA